MIARLVFLVLFTALLSGPALAQEGAIAEPTLVIRDDTGECAEIFLEVQCHACELPPGWAIIDSDLDEARCKRYIDLHDNVSEPLFCWAIETEECCTEGISIQGECGNLAINETERKCTFAGDISECESLPEGWQRSQGNLCPGQGPVWPEGDLEAFDWLEESLECLTPSGDGAGNGLLPVLPVIQNPATGKDIAPLELAAIILVAVGALSFIAYKKLRV